MNNNLKPIETLRPFTRFLCTIGELPTSYLVSMTYEEQLLWFCNYLEKTVIPTIDNNAEAVKELQNLYIELKTYVDNYFDNLDVQEEINNKLDEMADNGELTDIIAQYLGLAGMITFDNIDDMKLAENLVNGSKCCTLGYTTVNDEGGALYKIRNITNSDVVDNSTIIALHDQNLIAELIVNEVLNIKQVGGKGDNSTDDLTALNNANKTNAETIYFPSGNYIFKGTIQFSKNLKGKSATLKMNRTNEDEFGIILTGNNISVEGLNFHAISSNKLMEVVNSNNLSIRNCKFTSETTGRTEGGLLDIYSTNKNILVENCYFETHTSGTGGIWVREGTTSGNTSNVLFNNCEFIGDTVDETIAIWGWKGTVDNILVTNSKITRPLNANVTNSFTITIGQGTGTTKNSGFDNCVFDIYQNTSCLISGATANDSNIFIRNSIINSYVETLTNGIIATSSADGEGVKIDNCVINLLNTTANPALTNNQATKFKNTIFNCETQIFIEWGDYENCIFNNKATASRNTRLCRSLWARNCIFNNLNYTGTYLMSTVNTNDSFKIDNCKFYGTIPYRFIIASGTAYKSSEPFRLTNSFIHGQVNADSSNIASGCVCGNYNSYTGMGTQSANLSVANNEVSFNY